MAFPPNYNQERNNRDKAKQRKASEKLEKRNEKKMANREGEPPVNEPPPVAKKDD